MKKIIYTAAILAIAACSGSIDPEQDGQNPDGTPDAEIPEEYVGPYTLSADKTEVEASGKDYVTFSLKDAYDRDLLTDKKALQRINIVSAEGRRVDRMDNKTVFIANGEYNFTATYSGQKSENTLKIEAKNRGKYEKFHKNVAIYKATATWCQYCPSMTKALDGMNDDAKNHSVELCWHSDDAVAVTFPGSNNDCGTLVAAYLNDGKVALPTVVLDVHELVTERASSTLENAIWNLRAEYPATCGIKAAADYENGEIRITAELTSATGNEYDMGCAVLLNDQVLPGGTAENSWYTHIVRATTGNYLMCSNGIKAVEKDGILPYEHSFAAESIDEEKISVVVFALVKHEGAARIDNIVEVKLGESVDYAYNE